MPTDDKIMFEVYREGDSPGGYRVVFFTELDDHNKDREIARASAGEHFFDGFLKTQCRADGKQKLQDLLARLNKGESLTAEQAEGELADLGVLSD